MLKGKIINYSITYSKRKTLSLNVNKNLNVIVKAPTFVNQEFIHNFVLSKSSWISKKLEYFNNLKLEKERQKEINNNKVYWLGNFYDIKIYSENLDKVTLYNNFINVYTDTIDNELHVKHLIDNWHWTESTKIFKEISEKYFKNFAQYKLKNPIIVTASMKGKWGQCDSHGVIKLNKELTKSPIECVEYVIVHELCHLLVKNHGKNFYELMNIHYPNWRNARKSLRKFTNYKLD